MASNPQMTLALFLVREIVPNAIKKGLFGGPHIPFADLINICGYLFQSGAIIGRARRSQSESLATMFSEPGRESDAIDGIKLISTRHLDEYRRVFGEEPTAFPTYVTGLEYQRAGITMPFGKAQLTGSIQQHIKRVEKQSKDKVPLGFADDKLQMTAVEGIGFGIEFPELTEHMYREANENIDKKDWDNARQAGLDIPQNPDVITLEEQEDITLSEVAAYASQHYPRLVALLDLNKYLE